MSLPGCLCAIWIAKLFSQPLEHKSVEQTLKQPCVNRLVQRVRSSAASQVLLKGFVEALAQRVCPLVCSKGWLKGLLQGLAQRVGSGVVSRVGSPLGQGSVQDLLKGWFQGLEGGGQGFVSEGRLRLLLVDSKGLLKGLAPRVGVYKGCPKDSSKVLLKWLDQ